MNRKGLQIAIGLLTLLGWGALGAYGVPAGRLESLVNFPNPFDSRQTQTTILYQLEQDARVNVRLYDLFGNSVREWEFGAGEPGGRAGANRVAWDGTNESGDKVAAGGYVCRVTVDEGARVSMGVRKVGVVH